MALFGWKKKPTGDAGNGDNGAGGAGSGNGGGGGGAYEFSPEKAARWFEHARTSHEAGNYEYAMTCWLSGLRLEPTNIDAIQSLFAAAAAFAKPVTKDLSKAASGKTDVDRFLAALLNFSCKPSDAELAVRMVTAASEAALSDVVRFLAPFALRAGLDGDRTRKDVFVRLMDACEKAGSFELAVKAGECACRLDPSDSKLQTHVRNLAAQGTMTKGGYDQTGQDGGFRQNIRDAEKQRQLEEQERVVRNETVLDRTVASARQEYEARPNDRPTIKKYAEELLKRKRPEDISTAYEVLMKGYRETQEFRFRELAGKIKMSQAAAAAKQLAAAAAANPADAAAASALADAQAKLLELETGEFEARVAAYPTDLTIKFELGRRYFLGRRFDDAIDMLQQAKDDTRNRATVLSLLGEAFAAKGWHEEAIGTFRLALEGHADPNDAPGMELRYGLMCSLQKHAEDQKNVAAAEEAAKLAQQIAVQQISFKDVRTRRDQIKALIASLRG